MDKDQIIRRACHSAFGSPLVVNNFRGLIAEAIIAEALQSDWKWVSGDWASWDFKHESGARLEVKQSAALQSWHDGQPKRWSPRFDINDRTGRWEGANWVSEAGRPACIYVFATHSLINAKTADHRDPRQWNFYIVDERVLPRQKTVGLAGIARIADPCDFEGLQKAVETMRLTLAK